MSQSLRPAERQELKALAHALDPVVIVGEAGLTPAVLAEIDRSLAAHELIKVRVGGDDREARLAMRDRVVAELDAASVQVIGKLLVFYRAKPPEAPVQLRVAKKAKVRRAYVPTRKISSRKLKTAASPPRTARVRKAGVRSTKKSFQDQ
jgi:putative YhbY family RNA-binding protein